MRSRPTGQDPEDSDTEPKGERRLGGQNRPIAPVEAAGASERRVLFLDDDEKRAEVFLEQAPEAVWVTTVTECITLLGDPWDEVHLDHDLAGETWVDVNRDDTGMEVIRWICKEPRHHLKKTRFFVHTHNLPAGLLMVLQMRDAGYAAEFRPFGHNLEKMLEGEKQPAAQVGAIANVAPKKRGRWLSWIRSLLRLQSK
jgi:hypothetical protein